VSGALYTALGSGLVATLRRGDEVQTVHFGGGTPREALAQLVGRCDAEGWRIVCISTPTTILRDLAGSREYHAGGTNAHPSVRDGSDVATPERSLLNHVHRLDLLI
jgi:hypothetical protein